MTDWGSNIIGPASFEYYRKQTEHEYSLSFEQISEINDFDTFIKEYDITTYPKYNLLYDYYLRYQENPIYYGKYFYQEYVQMLKTIFGVTSSKFISHADKQHLNWLSRNPKSD